MHRPPFLRGTEAFFLLFGGIWLLVGVPFFVIGAYAGLQLLALEQTLQKEGAVVSGVVIEKFTRTHKGHRADWVHYQFSAPGAQVIEDSAEIEPQVWDGLAEQQPISVEYAASDPRLHRIAGQRVDRVFPILFAGLGALFATAGGVIFGMGVSRVRRRKRLEREGIRAEGIVTRVEERNVRINRVTQWTIYYTYGDFQGRSHEGDSGIISPGEASQWQPGDTGQVRYDANRPEESIWVGQP